MSNEWRKRALPPVRLRASASAIVRPMTNCSAISRIACRIATRTTGSPARATTRSYQLAGSLRRLGVDLRQPAGQHQPPGRRIDQQRRALSEVLLPVAARELVADQPVGGLGVRDAQQRFGDAHQQHAFLRRQVVLLQERFDAGACPPGARAPLRPRTRARALIRAAAPRIGRSPAAAAARPARFVGEEIGADRRSVGAFGQQWIGHGRGMSAVARRAPNRDDGPPRARPMSPPSVPRRRRRPHHREHVRRLDASSRHLRLVASMNTIDEFPVPLRVDREIRAEAAVDKRVDDIGKSDEDVEAETLDQQRQDILRADSFKSFGRAIPVEEFVFLSFQLAIVAVRRRQLTPELAHDGECLRPALVAVASDHVGDDEPAVRSERGGNGSRTRAPAPARDAATGWR